VSQQPPSQLIHSQLQERLRDVEPAGSSAPLVLCYQALVRGARSMTVHGRGTGESTEVWQALETLRAADTVRNKL
jgi:hypothetical protein